MTKIYIMFANHLFKYFFALSVILHVGIWSRACVPVFGDSIQPILAGDLMPDEFWDIPVTHIMKGDIWKASLKRYKGKLIILDFWATWCSPCVASIPKLDSLQSRFKNDLAIIPVTSESSFVVSSFFAHMRKSTGRTGFSVVDDSILKRYFPHQVLPHYVWIGKDGMLKGITEGNQVTAFQIQQILNNQSGILKQKANHTYAYNEGLSLFENWKQSRESEFILNQTFTGYMNGAKGKQVFKRDNDRIRLLLLNTTLKKFYAIAYMGIGPHLFNLKPHIRLSVRDSSAFTSNLSGDAYLEWAGENTYCYDVEVRKADSALAFALLRQNLEHRLPYKAVLKQEEVACLILINPTGVDLRSKGGAPAFSIDAFHFSIQNQPFAHLLNRLKLAWQNDGRKLIDESGITGNVDIRLDARLTDFNAVKRVLNEIGLDIIEGKRKIEVLHITDRDGHHSFAERALRSLFPPRGMVSH